MRTELNHTLTEDCSSEWIESRLQAALDTFAAEIDRICVTTGDVNAAKGGCDKTCRVTAHLRNGAVLTVSDRRSDLPAAVMWAAGKIAEVIRRRLDRRNSRQRSRPSFGHFPAKPSDREDFDDSGESERGEGSSA